jgi:hypothetical protein
VLGATVSRRDIVVSLAALLLAACAAPRIVPVPAAGVQVDPAQGTASVAAEGVTLAVQPSAWDGSPSNLRDYVTPFLVSLSNDAATPLDYDYTGFRLFDDSRFQYTALPPTEVERLLRWSPAPVDWWWYRYGWYGWPWYYPALPPPLGDVYARALPMGALYPGARLEGYIYFLRLRKDVRRVTLEFHHRVGELPRVLTLPFEVLRDRDAAAAG